MLEIWDLAISSVSGTKDANIARQLDFRSVRRLALAVLPYGLETVLARELTKLLRFRDVLLSSLTLNNDARRTRGLQSARS